jgi:hypothetical protein
MSEEFYYVSLAIETWVDYIMASILIIVSLASIIFAAKHKNQSSLVVLDVLLIINSILQMVVITDVNGAWPFAGV